ncbi:glycosyl hydrolase [Paenibacillus swuensis]|uniref:Glycosyl hydrolase n=1 Tax=Paenibacillus swuensis TaxID=1178515 RepID=A0A172TNA8_9BACL|nr:glycoside hydrolase family 88 protein [Paenibacillus swuensis]ANE48510.1 glycosyl hydrolase [Paenibacillus swuensis]
MTVTLTGTLLQRLEEKVLRMVQQMGDKSPHVARADGKYDDMATDWWTSGFWPGMLWIMYDMTGNEKFKEAAWGWDAKIEPWLTKTSLDLHHDVGFQFLATAVIKHTLTGDADGLRRGLQAANFLAGRFNPAGNFIRAWNGDDNAGWAIIDCMMNISLLFWASEVTGDPRYRHIAVRHADTALANFIREDGSVRHIVSFDPETGGFIEAFGGQGFAPDSAWSRGNAWALHGFANVYRWTKDVKYLHAAKRVAHYFIAALPEDGVAHWDFRTGENNPPRDSSASAIAASGLLEIADAVGEGERGLYLKKAEHIVASLTENYGTWDDPSHEAILTQGTGHLPANSNINVSLIYGDYYYIEAVAKLNGWKHRIH